MILIGRGLNFKQEEKRKRKPRKILRLRKVAKTLVRNMCSCQGAKTESVSEAGRSSEVRAETKRLSGVKRIDGAGQDRRDRSAVGLVKEAQTVMERKFRID